MYTIKQDPDALDLSNRPQHLLSPSIDNEDDEDYLHTDDEQQTDQLPETSTCGMKVRNNWNGDHRTNEFTKFLFSSICSRKQPTIVALLIRVTKTRN